MFTALIWFALAVVFLLIEGNTVMLVSVWFAAGGLVAMLAALLGAPFWLQLILFLGISAGLLALLRPLVRKYLKPKITATNVETGEIYEVSTSVLAYLKLGLAKSTNETQKNLFRAMYYYNQAANTFFGK